MYVLGINGNLGRESNDPAAFLLRDGKLVYGAEEERFNRIKYAPGLLPTFAIRASLSSQGIGLDELAGVAFPQTTWGDEFTQRLMNYFQFEFGVVPSLSFFDHHESHAASAYFGSGFGDALVVTVDGSGDGVSTAIHVGSVGGLRPGRLIRAPDSLGMYYSMATQYLGFVKNSDEYKVMALAAFGSARYDLSDILVDHEGGYTLNESYLHAYFVRGYPRVFTKQEPIFSDRLVERFGPPRLPGQPITQAHMDFAASVQARLAAVVRHLVSTEVAATSLHNLCLAGGVALNGCLNASLAALPGVEAFYVPPVPHDAGCALGAAMLLARQLGHRIEPVRHAFFGDEYSDDAAAALLRANGIAFRDYGEFIGERVAQDLAQGDVVAWFEGPMEVGPRALGSRSLLADPRQSAMKDRINGTIKHREAFQPLAPTVLAADASEFFELRGSSPFMSRVVPLTARGTALSAIAHVDGTARVQTLERGMHPRFERLLNAWRDRSGLPVLLNTSLNRRGEPIARTPAEALAILYSTDVDGVALGSCYVTKRS